VRLFYSIFSSLFGSYKWMNVDQIKQHTSATQLMKKFFLKSLFLKKLYGL
jgi:hypothetical protein